MTKDDFLISDSTYSLWVDLLKRLLKEGVLFKDHTGRFCNELLNLNLKLTSFEDIKEPINKMLTLKDLIYPKASEIKSIILDNLYDFNKVYPYSYVSRIFSYEGFNQINSYILPLLKKNPLSRQGIVSIWNPLKDSQSDLVPSLIYVSFIKRKDSLYLSAALRSCDVFIGLPANLYQLYVLGVYVAEHIGVSLKEINLNLISAHIFEDNFDKINNIF